MLLYSKRNKAVLERSAFYSSSSSDEDRQRRIESFQKRRLNPLHEQLRIRLHKQITIAIESGEFLEPFLTVSDVATGRFHLNSEALRKLSLSELGYDITKIVDCDGLSFNQIDYNDFHFFDLIELLVIFSKDEKRQTFALRIQDVFSEEDNTYLIHDFMITKKGSGLQAALPLLQDKEMQELVKDFYETTNHIDKARISAGIIQRLFSSPKEGETKNYAEQVCEDVAKQWTDKDNVASLKKLLNDTIKNAKSLINQVSNIRHTDKFSIPIEGPSLYKMIAKHNISIAEFVILSLPEQFVISQKATDLKQAYLAKYGVDKTVLKEVDSSVINLEDIPF